MSDFPYTDSSLTIRARVEDLLGRMSLEEKIGQINQHLYGWQCVSQSQTGSWYLTDMFKRHVEWSKGLGALYGAFRADPWSKIDFTNGVRGRDGWRITNLIQDYVKSHSRWGIPALIVEECPHGHQGLDGISYPTNIGRGCMFNTDLIREGAHLMGRELSCMGVDLALVSTLDLARDPRWGRTEECFGEEPYLSAKYSEAIVEGFQGRLIRHGSSFLDRPVHTREPQERPVGAVLKHCIAQGDAQGGHNSGTVVIGDREFNDVYMPLMRAGREAVGIMAAYNDIDGVPCHSNTALLTDVLRTNVGFQGIVMADGIALDRLFGPYPTISAAAAAALTAGVDMSLWDDAFLHVDSAIKQNLTSELDLNRAVARVLSIKFLLGLFDRPPLTDPGEEYERVLKRSRELNFETARRTMVLVKNNGTLPFDESGKSIAVLGPNADSVYSMLGDYTAPQDDDSLAATILHELRKISPSATFTYAKGCEIRQIDGQDEALDDALACAQASDAVVLCLGGSSERNFNMEFLRNGAVSSRGANMDSGENVDVASLSLGGCQMQMAREVAKLGKPMVSVLVQGRPYDIQELEQLSDAVLIAWYPGQSGGAAVARVLTGADNPSGKLSISYPRNASQLPVYHHQRRSFGNADYLDEPGSPLHPFGFGLSYTNISYHDLIAHISEDNVEIRVQVRNLGDRGAIETILAYVELIGGGVLQREMLQGFESVKLNPGEVQSVIIRFDRSAFSYMDARRNLATASRARIRVNELETLIDLSEGTASRMTDA
ncbi:glycoside hydrolase family 3 domain protein [Coriobacterium glomerans PW2]|uniref:Glycoside hydrolase family 3 domain protein n=1 Tax=Coriobacterium glomerans (strain ATCC 49209 / DSM 20642 / JCM 10262 / PW2) TaxID=700015 RepID=F2N9A5_CORGP|nr:glycoside hydrolase family 3 N-terminal domain-containing protein [Coriobacterium glomerans]AEB07853.1 glycoside hydrolase family 3 domain protein [Coriobacterium glomerans PW2]